MISRPKIENQTYRKNAKKLKLHKIAYPREPPGGIPNIYKSRCHQTPNTFYRIKKGPVEKKIKFWN